MHARYFLGAKLIFSEKNIILNQNGQITFQYIESKTGKTQNRTLKGEAFLFLILQHVLSKGFRRVRLVFNSTNFIFVQFQVNTPTTIFDYLPDHSFFFSDAKLGLYDFAIEST